MKKRCRAIGDSDKASIDLHHFVQMLAGMVCSDGYERNVIFLLQIFFLLQVSSMCLGNGPSVHTYLLCSVAKVDSI